MVSMRFQKLYEKFSGPSLKAEEQSNTGEGFQGYKQPLLTPLQGLPPEFFVGGCLIRLSSTKATAVVWLGTFASRPPFSEEAYLDAVEKYAIRPLPAFAALKCGSNKLLTGLRRRWDMAARVSVRLPRSPGEPWNRGPRGLSSEATNGAGEAEFKAKIREPGDSDLGGGGGSNFVFFEAD